MAENDARPLNEDEEPTPLVVPSHSPLPPPPEVLYTRPLEKPKNAAGPGFGATESRPDDGSHLGSGAVKLGSGLAAATTFAASIIAGFLIGQWVDHRWNHSGGLPWGTIVFSLAGVAAGFLNLFRVLSATDRGKK